MTETNVVEEIATLMSSIHFELGRLEDYMDLVAQTEEVTPEVQTVSILETVSELRMCFNTLEKMGVNLKDFSDNIVEDPSTVPAETADLTQNVNDLTEVFNRHRISYGQSNIQELVDRVASMSSNVPTS